jgi:hypothetical protein
MKVRESRTCVVHSQDSDNRLTRFNKRPLEDTKTRTCAVSHMTCSRDGRYGEITPTGDDIAWIRSLTKLPLVIKGIQCIEVSARHRYLLAMCEDHVFRTRSELWKCTKLTASCCPITVAESLTSECDHK